jgi:hypothetical protein
VLKVSFCNRYLIDRGADPNALDSMTHVGRYLHDNLIPGNEEVDDETSVSWLCMFSLHVSLL